MANEAVIYELFNGIPAINFTIASGAAIEKGTLMAITGSRTAAAASTAGQPFAGITASEKVVSGNYDTSSTLGLHTCGIFGLKATADPLGIPLGSLVEMSGANQIRAFITLVSLSGGSVVGKALSAAAASAVIPVAVGVY